MLKSYSVLNIKEKYLICLIAGFVFFLSYRKLNLFFLSDDFTFIYRYQYLKDVFNASSAHHINPVPQFFIFYLGNFLAGFNPFYYHTVTLLLHIGNVLLVFSISKVLFNDKWISFTASILFSTFFMNYEVIYWITGIYYILLITFYISTILLYKKYLETKEKKYYILFLTTFTFAVFTMEQAVTLLASCVVLEILLPENLRQFQLFKLKQKVSFLVKISKRYIIPLIILIAFFIFKLVMKQKFIVNTHNFESFIKTISGMIWYLFIPHPYGISNGILYGTSKWNYRIFLFLLISGITSYFFIRHYKQLHNMKIDNKTIFASDAVIQFFLFACILIYVIPQSISTIIQARYFYLPSVFSSIILGCLLVKSILNVLTLRGGFKIFLYLTIIVFIGASIPINIRFLNKQYEYWETASEITKNIIKDTELYLTEGLKEQYLYYVNLPDGIYGREDYGWPNAYIFRNGISEAVRLVYPSKNIDMIKACRNEDTKGVVTWVMHEFIPMSQLEQLVVNKNIIVLIYDPEIKTVRRLTVK